jgi:hypothetical protein
MERLNEPTREGLFAEQTVAEALEREFTRDDGFWQGWGLVRRPSFGGAEADLLAVNWPRQAFVVEIRWRRTYESLHLGAIRQLAATRRAFEREEHPGLSFANYVVARAHLQPQQHFVLPEPLAIEAVLLTNQFAEGRVAEAARELGIEVLGEDVDDPLELARLLIDYLRRSRRVNEL